MKKVLTSFFLSDKKKPVPCGTYIDEGTVMSKKAVEVVVKFKPVTSGRPVQVVAADGSEGAVFAMSGQSKK